MAERLGGDGAAEAFARKTAASNPASGLQGCSGVTWRVERVFGQRNSSYVLWRKEQVVPCASKQPWNQLRGISPFLPVAWASHSAARCRASGGGVCSGFGWVCLEPAGRCLWGRGTCRWRFIAPVGSAYSREEPGHLHHGLSAGSRPSSEVMWVPLCLSWVLSQNSEIWKPQEFERGHATPLPLLDLTGYPAWQVAQCKTLHRVCTEPARYFQTGLECWSPPCFIRSCSSGTSPACAASTYCTPRPACAPHAALCSCSSAWQESQSCFERKIIILKLLHGLTVPKRSWRAEPPGQHLQGFPAAKNSSWHQQLLITWWTWQLHSLASQCQTK